MVFALTMIGAFTVAAFFVFAAFAFCVVLKEALRSYWQTCRKARIIHGRNWRSRVKRWFFVAWWREFFFEYDHIILQGFVLPHDVAKPVKRDHWY